VFPHYGPLTATKSILDDPILSAIWNTNGTQRALRNLLSWAQIDQREYGVYFIKDPRTGEITAGPLITGGSDFINMGRPPANAISDVHIHWTPRDINGIEYDRGPSMDDRTVAQALGFSRILVEWDGTVSGYGP
jgi:hypothetical protein